MHDMKSPLIFGEIVFGRYKSEKERPGGSPYNVAWHLKGFGLDPIFITRIGIKSKGIEVNEEMEAWGLNTEFIQRNTRFRSGAAFNVIDISLIDENLFTKHFSLIYYNTLSLLNNFSLKALNKLKERIKIKIYFDVNLIAPWWKKESILEEIEDATWIKCSQRELKIIGNLTDFVSNDLNHVAQNILKRFDLEVIMVTLGEECAFITTNNDEYISSELPLAGQIVDITGMGDAFAAVSIIGLIYNWPPFQILRRANEFAAHIIQKEGALLNDKLLYDIFREKWDLK